jgi:hypothetical protein
MARKLARLIEEQEDKSKQLRTIKLAIKVERTQESLKNLAMQERRAPTLKIVREEVLHSIPLKYPRNKNGKRNLVTQIIGKK